MARRRAPPGSQPVLAANAEYRRRAPRVHHCPLSAGLEFESAGDPCGAGRPAAPAEGERRLLELGREKALRRKFAKGQAANTETFGTTMDDGAIVLGTVELTANAVTLSVNSEARAVRGRTMLEPVLTGLVRAPLIERQTVEQMMASARERPSARDALRLPPNEERRIRERSGEGDRLVEDGGEPFRTAGAGRSGRQLRLHLDLEGTWPRRRAAMKRAANLLD